MPKMMVVVPKLNKRSTIPVTFPDTNSIAGIITEGTTFMAEEITDVPNPELGKWFQDRDGYFYWAEGLREAPDTGTGQLFSIDQYWWLKDYGVDKLWEMGLTGAGVKVAVLDTGLALPHPDLNINARNCHDVTGSTLGIADISLDSHGTHCAGIIKASNNGFGVTGIAYDCDFYFCKVSKDRPFSSSKISDDITLVEDGIKWAISQGVQVISISKGFLSYWRDIRSTIQSAVNTHNILVVCAGGNNDKITKYTELFYPAKYPECLSVGAAGPDKNVSSTSITSAGLHLLAPGVGIYSTVKESGYAALSGSSQAAPFVAGIAALIIQYLRERKQGYTVKGLIALLCSNGDPSGNNPYKIINPLQVIKAINDGQAAQI